MLECKDHWGYTSYNTKIGTKYTNLKIDLLEEVTRYAREFGIKVMAYYSLGFDSAIVERNPDWSEKDIDGNPMRVTWSAAFKGFRLPCPNSPYRKFALQQLNEISAYDIDMVFIDAYYLLTGDLTGVGKTACYCEYCKRKFRETFGKEIPINPDWNKEWKQQVKWRLDYLEDFWQEIVTHIHNHKPEIPVFRNYGIDLTGWLGGERARLVKGEEFLFAEAESVKHDKGCPILYSFGYMASIAKGFTGRKAFQFIIASTLPVNDPCSSHHFKASVMNILTHGGIPMMGALQSPFYPNGKLDRGFFKSLAGAYSEFSEKEE